MTHLQIYDKLSQALVKIGTYQAKNRVGTKDSAKSLEYFVFSACLNIVLQYIAIFNTQKFFCGHCFYTNLNNGRRAIHRYLVIETEITAEDKKLFRDVYAIFNAICLDLSKTQPPGDQCGEIENTALQTLIDNQENAPEDGLFE